MSVLLSAALIFVASFTAAATLFMSSRTRLRKRLGGDTREPLMSAMTRHATDLVKHVPKPHGFEQKLDAMLDRAGWPIRTGELMVVQGVGGMCGSVLGLMLGSPLLAILLAAAGVAGPRIILRVRVARRTRAFMGQLPDTLQLLAGSLRAGYGLLQALDTVSKEMDAPAGPEFSRVLSEARLGMPLDEALDGLAERIGSDDLRWVVIAIQIQRQVGGNLAEVLDTAGNTLREREQIRRQVKVLSAEGRLSAVVLGLLPIALAVYMAVVNPSAISMLFGTAPGRVMSGGAITLMAVGAVWMRKVIRIKV